MHRKLFSFILILLFLLPAAQSEADLIPLEITDSTGRTVMFDKSPERVVALSASIAEAWLLAGGTLCGVTDDAFERGLEIAPETPVIGTIKAPSAEVLVSLAPDLILLTDDTVSHVELVKLLDDMRIPYLAISLDTFEDYRLAMEAFTQLTASPERYDLYVNNIQKEIAFLLERIPPDAASPSALFLRAFSSGVKVKAHDHIVCDILEEIGANNIAAGNPYLEEMSLEAIAKEDPEYIFVVAMGDEEKAIAYLDNMIQTNPIWQALSAVRNERLIVLSQELYHYKPNHRWAESYSTLLEILYSDVYIKEEQK